MEYWISCDNFKEVGTFARDQQLRLETPGWHVLDFQGNPLREDELEPEGEKIVKGPLVAPVREHPFAEDLIVGETEVLDPNLSVLVKLSSLVQVRFSWERLLAGREALVSIRTTSWAYDH